MIFSTLCDTGSVLELRGGFGRGVVTALVRVEGRPIGLIANDPTRLGGAIDAGVPEPRSGLTAALRRARDKVRQAATHALGHVAGAAHHP